MERRAINPTKTGWAQAHEVKSPSRWLYVSGQVPEDAEGRVPTDITDQCRLAWSNIEAQLIAADLGLTNIVKMTIFLSDRQYIQPAYEVRKEVLGRDINPAMTIIITGIYDPKWLLEIECVAAD
jgi:2-iminobutanoate/2-iminopropanoate deaminase